MKKNYFLFALILLSSISMLRAQKIDNLIELKQKSQNPLFHQLGKAIKTPAFESEGYWSWGSSVVKGDDGKYHMFVSPFSQVTPLPSWLDGGFRDCTCRIECTARTLPV